MLGVFQDIRAHTELVEDSLPACCVTITVACYSRLYIIIVDLGIQHCFDTCFIAHLWISTLLARLDELSDANTQHVSRDIVLRCHP